MPTFSFDIVSEIDKAEMNNVFTQAEKEIATRYDFRGTAAAVEWLEDKKEFKLTGDSEWQIDAVLDMARTCVNVTGDMCVSTVIAKTEGEKL